MPSIAPTPAVALLPKVVERLHLRDDRGQALDGMNHLGDGNPSIGLIVHPGHVGSAIPQSRGADLGRVLVVQMGRLEKVQFVGHGETRRHLYPHRISPRIGASQRRVQAGYVLLRETTNNPLTKKCTFIQGTSTPFNPLPFLPPVGEPAATAHSRICDTPSLSTVDSHSARSGSRASSAAAVSPQPLSAGRRASFHRRDLLPMAELAGRMCARPFSSRFGMRVPMAGRAVQTTDTPAALPAHSAAQRAAQRS